MRQVEILLDFIRVERDNNRILRIETFTAMLPWFIIYGHTIYAGWGGGQFTPSYMKPLEKNAPEVRAGFLDGHFVVKRTKR